MTKRVATMCLTAILLIGLASLSIEAQSDDPSGLGGISAVSVLVEPLPDGAKALGLTSETIQTDVELKLRLAGMRVVTREEGAKLPGGPFVYVNVNLTSSAEAASIDVDLAQNALLQRNGQLAPSAITWFTGSVSARPTVQSIRDRIKDLVDKFLNDWLSVNPKK